MNFSIEIKGQEEALKSIREMAKALDPGMVEPVLMEGAKVIAAAAQEKAPGGIKKAIVTKFLRQISNYPRSAMAGVNNKKAPEAHLIEYGTKPRYQKSGRYTGIGPAKPFWRPAVDANIAGAFSHVKEKLMDMVIQRFRKA